jgi:hypothetical protein
MDQQQSAKQRNRTAAELHGTMVNGNGNSNGNGPWSPFWMEELKFVQGFRF